MKYVVWILLCAIGAASCRKFVQVSPPDTQLSTGTVFSSDRTAVAALMGMYSRAMTTQGLLLNGGNTLYPALSSDECTPTQATPAILEFSSDALQSSNTNIPILYGSAYNTIYNANTLLENLSVSPAISDATKKQLRGEALFMRALVYSYLTDLFGSVPLETSTNADVNAVVPGATVSDVYHGVLSDLAAADSLLDTAYAVAPGADPGDRTRPNRWAVRSLQARVCLNLGEWAAAEKAASDVIDSKAYQLEPAIDSVFRMGSREAIWQLQPVSPVMNSAEGYIFLPLDNAQSRPAYVLTPYQPNAFEVGDLRRTHWVGQKQVGGLSYFYPAKYKVRKGPPYTEYNTVIRLAELYLIRAEARLRQGSPQEAIRDLNIIRSRAHLKALDTGLVANEAAAAIFRERRTELFCEWGHRWSDLKRTGQADSVLSLEKPGWQHHAALYPIPLTEIQRNPALRQNPGYE